LPQQEKEQQKDKQNEYRKTSIKHQVPNKRRGSEARVLINAGSRLNAELF